MKLKLTSLVPDLLDGGTVRPLGPGIEALRNVRVRALEVFLDGGHEEVGRGVDAHEAPEIVGARLGVEVSPRRPGRVLGVDSLNKLLRENVVMELRSLDQQHAAQGHCEPHSEHFELRFCLRVCLYVSWSDAAMLLRRKYRQVTQMCSVTP